MDTIIWSDGHTTTINSNEAINKQYEVSTDIGVKCKRFSEKLN